MSLKDCLKLSFKAYILFILMTLPMALAICLGILVSLWFMFLALLYLVTIPIAIWLCTNI